MSATAPSPAPQGPRPESRSAPAQPAAASGLSITDFLTDGSLAALCDELTRLAGVPVALRDPSGHLIVRSDGAAGSRPWRLLENPSGPVGVADLAVPLRVNGQPIGHLVLGAGEPKLPPQARTVLERSVALVAQVAGEFCNHELELRHRIKELGALYRLSSLLAGATDVDRVLEIALELALDVLELDAGSIVLFEDRDGVSSENEEDLLLKASRRLSREWLDSPLPLSKDRLFDRLALGGEVVVSEDLFQDDRVLIVDQVRREGLRAFINAGLTFNDRPIGVIRLYARRPRTFDETDRRLIRSIAQQAAVAVEQARLLKLQKQDEVLQRQLQLAADVQRRMLPRHVPNLPRLDLAARYVPSSELGGDFYDLIEAGGSLGMAIGDVVGKGIAAALLMSSVRASLRAYVQDVYHIDDVMSRVNVALCRDTRDNEFATLWYGVIDPERLRLAYCSAGHEPPFVVRVPRHRPPSAADIDELGVGGMAVGIDPSQRYPHGIYDLQPGDVLVAYTDGVPDTVDFSGRRFGKTRLRQAVLTILTNNPQASAAEVVEHIYWELRQFAGLAERTDDQTVGVLRIRA